MIIDIIQFGPFVFVRRPRRPGRHLPPRRQRRRHAVLSSGRWRQSDGHRNKFYYAEHVRFAFPIEKISSETIKSRHRDINNKLVDDDDDEVKRPKNNFRNFEYTRVYVYIYMYVHADMFIIFSKITLSAFSRNL